MVVVKLMECLFLFICASLNKDPRETNVHHSLLNIYTTSTISAIYPKKEAEKEELKNKNFKLPEVCSIISSRPNALRLSYHALREVFAQREHLKLKGVLVQENDVWSSALRSIRDEIGDQIATAACEVAHRMLVPKYPLRILQFICAPD